MPNWCSNRLTITGDWKDLRDKTEGGFNLSTFLPTPDEGRAQLESKDCWLRRHENSPPRDGEGWYYWRIQFWGCKWDVKTPGWAEEEDKIIAQFDSAWAPPEPGIQAISALYPHAEFSLEYAEPGCDFCGAAMFKAGQVLSDIEGKPSDREYDKFPLMAELCESHHKETDEEPPTDEE